MGAGLNTCRGGVLIPHRETLCGGCSKSVCFQKVRDQNVWGLFFLFLLFYIYIPVFTRLLRLAVKVTRINDEYVYRAVYRAVYVEV